ncbi:unnamed protein product [Effrenium voratum]|uniref:EF-hand domain-containing protein n=1 Tax=Effrenium voratum TaxID=2562239 RepID=A0AA36MTT6_9DINO|nr:unnamed protein product [Effrenium voratum]
MRACNGAVQGLVERYLATLFYQCSQIAAFLEGSPVLPLERTGVERKVAAPEVPRKCPARPTRRSYGILEAPPEPDSTAPDLSTSGMVDTGDGAYDAGSECADKVLTLEPSALAPLLRPKPPPPPPSPSAAPAASAPCAVLGPWNPWSADNEAQRLRRLLQPIQSSRSLARDKLKPASPSPGECIVAIAASKAQTRVSTSTRRSKSRPSMASPSGSKAPSRSCSRLPEENLSATLASEGPRSIFALPDEDVEKVPKRMSRGRGSRTMEGFRFRRYSGSDEGERQVKAWQVRQQSAEKVNQDMETKLLERFRHTKEDTLCATAPDSTENVMMLHQLAAMVTLSFDDARMAKAAFEKQDDGSGYLSYDAFVQAVLQIHREMNSSFTAASMAECENLCSNTFPGGSSGRKINLLEFLQWYSTYGFNEEFLLAPEMRTMRRLSRQYGIPWEEVDNVKRQFDAVDTDRSGYVDFEEFTEVLRKVLQVPAHLELPVNRARYFWKQLDIAGSGKADFAEFLPWWLKYFHHKDGKKMLAKPFEDFYKSVRNLKNPDPPAQKSNQLLDFELDKSGRGGLGSSASLREEARA